MAELMTSFPLPAFTCFEYGMHDDAVSVQWEHTLQGDTHSFTSLLQDEGCDKDIFHYLQDIENPTDFDDIDTKEACDSEEDLYQCDYADLDSPTFAEYPQTIDDVLNDSSTNDTDHSCDETTDMVMPTILEGRLRQSSHDEPSDTESDEDIHTPTRKPRRERKGLKLWQFLLQTLNNDEYNPAIIQWVNKRERIFKFVQSKKVAQLWGQKRKNSSMSYEYLSRAMRHYYARGIMSRIPSQRLVYKFGPEAERWWRRVTGQ